MSSTLKTTGPFLVEDELHPTRPKATNPNSIVFIFFILYRGIQEAYQLKSTLIAYGCLKRIHMIDLTICSHPTVSSQLGTLYALLPLFAPQYQRLNLNLNYN